MRKNLPKFLYNYFWEIDPKKLDVKERSDYVIERILEWADFDGIKWMGDNFDKDEVTDVLKKSRYLSGKSANFWALQYNIPKEEVLCLKKQFQKKQKKTWQF